MKKIAILIAALLLGGCASTKKQTPAYTTIIATVGTVAHVDISTKPVTYSAKEVTLNFTNKGIVTTFTDVVTGNRISVDGDCLIDNIQKGDVIIRDFRNKDQTNANNSTAGSASPPRNP